MSFSYIIDNREKYIKLYFEKHQDSYPEITYENLTLGDIIINYNNIPLIIIERKTINDLLASIKDGRYKEQKQRIIDSNIKHKIYLIENDGKYNWLTKTEEKITLKILSIYLLINAIKMIKGNMLIKKVIH